MPDANEPTIIDREVPPPPPPPRQVIFERLPTPSAKPRQIIFEKWMPYEEPEDRPCIVEKATMDDMPPPKNLIIQYEPAETKVQPQCIDEGISYVDPKQFVQGKSSENAEICYVDQLNNLVRLNSFLSFLNSNSFEFFSRITSNVNWVHKLWLRLVFKMKINRITVVKRMLVEPIHQMPINNSNRIVSFMEWEIRCYLNVHQWQTVANRERPRMEIILLLDNNRWIVF